MVSFTSHGAMVDVSMPGGVLHRYIPLTAMDAAPDQGAPGVEEGRGAPLSSPAWTRHGGWPKPSSSRRCLGTCEEAWAQPGQRPPREGDDHEGRAAAKKAAARKAAPAKKVTRKTTATAKKAAARRATRTKKAPAAKKAATAEKAAAAKQGCQGVCPMRIGSVRVTALPRPADVPPHRPPFLFLTEVTAVEPGAPARGDFGSWTVTRTSSPATSGWPDASGGADGGSHRLNSVGNIVVLLDPRYAGRLPLFGGIERARFRRQVVRGDWLQPQVTMAASPPGPARATGSLRWASTSAREANCFVIVDVLSDARPGHLEVTRRRWRCPG